MWLAGTSWNYNGFFGLQSCNPRLSALPSNYLRRAGGRRLILIKLNACCVCMFSESATMASTNEVKVKSEGCRSACYGGCCCIQCCARHRHTIHPVSQIKHFPNQNQHTALQVGEAVAALQLVLKLRGLYFHL